MVVGWFLDALKALLDWLVSIRPSWDISLPQGAVGLVDAVQAWDVYIPVHEALEVAGLFLTYVVVMNSWKWGVKVVDWVADVLP